MTSIRMALTELQRLTAGRLSRLALLTLVLVPTLFGALYFYANHDPYENLDQVPAALVVLDTGSTDASGRAVNAGREVADELVTEDSFEWHEVSADRARDGVREGTFDFALTVPADFSEALTSSVRFAPEQARLTMTTDDANSYLSTTIADTVTARVRDAIAERVGSSAAEQFVLGFGQVRGSLQDASDVAGTLRDGVVQSAAKASNLVTVAGRVQRGGTDLVADLTAARRTTSALPAQTDQIADRALAVADGNGKVAEVADGLRDHSLAAKNAYYDTRLDLQNRMGALGLNATQRSQLLAVYDQLGRSVDGADAAVTRGAAQLNDLSAAATRVASDTRTLANSVPALAADVRKARAEADGLAAGATRIDTGVGDVGMALGQLSSGSGSLAATLTEIVDSIPDAGDTERSQVARMIGDPVAITSVAESDAESYGAGLAPLFMALAAWIGGYVLFLLARPLSRRALAANQASLRVALGGWLTPALVGVAQMVVLIAVAAAAVRIVPENVPGTLLFLVLVSATFVAIMHALTAWFGTAGQLLGLALLVPQLITAGGTLPWQTIPEPLHWLHHLLPMSYAVDGLRQLMYGGLSTLVLENVVVLLTWLAIALFASSQAARSQRVWTVRRLRADLGAVR
jgi:putative membrane protein